MFGLAEVYGISGKYGTFATGWVVAAGAGTGEAASGAWTIFFNAEADADFVDLDFEMRVDGNGFTYEILRFDFVLTTEFDLGCYYSEINGILFFFN